MILLPLFLSIAAKAHAFDLALSGGYGTDARVTGASVELFRRTLSDPSKASASAVFIRIDASVATIDGHGPEPGSALVMGLTPLLRLERKAAGGVYAEIGVGANYFTNRRINQSKKMGTNFQFGDVIGFGIKLPETNLQVGYRFIHYSNAGMSTMNPGLDLHTLVLRGSF